MHFVGWGRPGRSREGEQRAGNKELDPNCIGSRRGKYEVRTLA
ncbi:hypothetical protein BRCON_2249 [Candidatus Sumerlaea chitinivorans]|uniref:Uncharacterized protein n=1 Tax=Sumerlaea chitinivorans TaxID=2250252 RepID=A0A2Z4Y7M3_SUMC1|nr:hypothetical protein BRCON_2249 [Candidatus Sumerlaea chitinivorans]